jgi:probable phosphoglycerate mutase
MTTIYLLRHGHYESPKPVAPYRLPGFHLSPEGMHQVEALAQTLREEKIAAVFTSPMERTRETADIVARPHHIVPVIDERLNEVQSPLQGKTPEEIHELGGWNWQIYDTPWYHERGGETLEAIRERVVTVIEEKRVAYSDRAICLISHGDPIMLAAAYYEGRELTAERLMAMQPYVPMAGGYRLVFEGDRVQGVYPIVAS